MAVAMEGKGARALTSEDGVTWTLGADTGAASWRRVIWAPEAAMFVAVGNAVAGSSAMVSADGVAWRGVDTPQPDQGWGNGRVLAMVATDDA